MSLVYKTIELTGTSSSGLDDAVKNAVSKAAETLRSIHWFHVTDIRGRVENNKIDHWQVTVEVNFALE